VDDSNLAVLSLPEMTFWRDPNTPYFTSTHVLSSKGISGVTVIVGVGVIVGGAGNVGGVVVSGGVLVAEGGGPDVVGGAVVGSVGPVLIVIHPARLNITIIDTAITMMNFIVFSLLFLDLH